jgi:hypothetical protein
MVTRLDLSALEADALEYVNQHREIDEKEPLSGVHVGHQWGIVDTPLGLYALCDEGVGRARPVSDEHPALMDIYEDAHQNEYGETYLSIVPCATLRATEADLRKAAEDGEQVPLQEFIRTFGARLDQNYEEWRRTLEHYPA